MKMAAANIESPWCKIEIVPRTTMTMCCERCGARKVIQQRQLGPAGSLRATDAFLEKHSHCKLREELAVVE